MIDSGYVAFYEINNFCVNMLFFHYWQHVFAAGLTGFAGRIWPAGGSLEAPDVEHAFVKSS